MSHSHDIWNVAALQAFGNWARLEKGEGGRAVLVTEPAGKGPQGGMRTGEQSRTVCDCSAKLWV